MSSPKTEDFKLLLPWYVNGTLGPDERANVDEHLDACHECSEAVVELRRIAAAIENEQATPLVPSPPVDAFLENLPQREVRSTRPRRIPLYAAAATILVLIGSVYLIATLPSESNVFQTVTDSPSAANVSYVFSIEIESEAAVSVQQAVESAIIEGDILKSENGYRVVVSLPSATMTELNGYADSLRQIDGVERVEVVGVQLPID